MQESTAVFGDETDEDYTAERSRLLAAHQCKAELGIDARTVRQWASRKRIFARALDGSGRCLYYEHELVALRDAQRDSAVRRVTVAQKPVTLSHSPHSTRVPSGRVLSCVPGQGGAVADQPRAPREVVVPVRLDLTQAHRELDEFCDHVTARIGQAMAAGFAAGAASEPSHRA